MKEESIGAFSLIDIKIFYVCSLSSGQFTFLYFQTDINNKLVLESKNLTCLFNL